jgi:hypothetical protein
LAKYDLLILPAEVQEYNPAAFTEIRNRNPKIIILAYLPTISYNFSAWHDNLHQLLLSQIKPTWWLRDTAQNPISIWPGTQAINITSDWKYVLPTFAAKHVMSTGNWDGIMYDEFNDFIGGTNNGDIDIIKDGIPDNPDVINAAWHNAITTILSYSREILGPEAMIITNGNHHPDFSPYINGRIFENFPTPWEGDGSWQSSMTSYLNLCTKAAKPCINIINGNTGNTGNYADFAKMRFALASTLLGDGYFSFDYGTTSHGQTTFTYEEEHIKLGTPLAKAIINPNGISTRRYQNGIVLVNPTSDPKTITLPRKYKKISGIQDPTVNDGKTVQTITIPPRDGIILVK